MKTRKQLSTEDRILDVAERHFAMYGFAGTSLRGIIKEADVNVAAIAYHYGTKEDLFQAVIERFARPVVGQQLAALDSLGDTPTLPGILRAFYTAPLMAVKSRAESGEILALFLGRAQTESEPIFSIIDGYYANCRSLFIQAFKQCMPEATAADLHWNFEFMLALIVTFLTRQSPIRQRYGDIKDWDIEEAVNRMILLCAAGMTGGS